MLTIHSIFLIKNDTSHNIQLRANILQLNPDKNRSNNIVSKNVPRTGYLAPSKSCYLPIPATVGVLLYTKAANYKRAEKDIIRISPYGENIQQQQGLYTCPSR